MREDGDFRRIAPASGARAALKRFAAGGRFVERKDQQDLGVKDEVEGVEGGVDTHLRDGLAIMPKLKLGIQPSASLLVCKRARCLRWLESPVCHIHDALP